MHTWAITRPVMMENQTDRLTVSETTIYVGINHSLTDIYRLITEQTETHN